MNYLPNIIADKLRHARHRIELQSRVTGDAAPREANGEVIQDFTTYAKPFACVEPLNGREMERAKSYGPEVSHKITLRYLAGVTAQHIALFEGRRLLINAAIRPNEVPQYLELYCSEFPGVAGGR